MSLRVLDDVRRGYARLEFDRRLDQPTLELSVRLLSDGQYLGAGGKHVKNPYYFTAERIEGDDRRTRFRVGPEIVNHLLDNDRIEIATADGSLAEEAYWENAVPEMPGQARSHTIFRAEPVLGKAAAPQPAPTRAPETKVEPPEDLPLPPAPPPPDPWRRWIPLGAAGLLLLLAAALLLIPSVRCSLFGGCADTATLLHEAMTCASSKPACAVPACFERYLGAVARSDVPASVTSTLQTAAKSCALAGEQEGEAAERARKCAAARTESGGQCEVRGQCIEKLYTSLFPNGPAKSSLESLAASADRECEAERVAADTSRSCVDTHRASNRHCDVEGNCIAPYRTAFPAGRSLVALNRLAMEARDACDLNRRTDQQQREEEQAFQSARTCSDSASNDCVRNLCWNDYLRQFERTGANAAKAKSAAQAAKDGCNTASIEDGVYTARSRSGCGEAPQSVRISIAGGKITWQYRLQGIDYQWSGTIDPQGVISASFSGASDYSAQGKFNGESREIAMHYPQCGSEPVVLTIWQRNQ